MKKILDYLISKLQDSDTLNEYNSEILVYGLEVLLYNGFTAVLVLGISLFFNELYFGTLFLIAFSIFRVLFGGFHAKTIYSCTIIMIMIVLGVHFINKFEFFHYYLITAVTLIVYCLIFFIMQNRHVYRKCIIVILFWTILILCNIPDMYTPVILALFIAEILYFFKK